MNNSSDLDINSLNVYLSDHIAEFSGLKNCIKFSNGQSNPTYLLTANSGKYVLRRQPFGTLLKSAHAVDREFRVMEALKQTDIPVPRMIHFSGDNSLMGCQFYVMEYVEGQIYWNPLLPDLRSKDRAEVYDSMNRVLAELHKVNLQIANLTDFGKPGNYFERQINRWSKQYQA